MITTTTMQTATGRLVDLRSMTVRDICVEDIAASLAKQCRYAGHCERDYKVAEHCVHVCDALVYPFGEAQRLVALAALLHDGSEAYLLDIHAPLKNLIGGVYRPHEARVQGIVHEAFDLPWPLPADWAQAIHKADMEVGAMEAAVFGFAITPGREAEAGPDTLRYWSAKNAEYHFLGRFRELYRAP